MAALVGVFLLVFLIGSQGARESRPELIVWNVGQGQWATVIDETACWHLDMGGEFAPWQEIMGACRKRATASVSRPASNSNLASASIASRLVLSCFSTVSMRPRAASGCRAPAAPRRRSP